MQKAKNNQKVIVKGSVKQVAKKVQIMNIVPTKMPLNTKIPTKQIKTQAKKYIKPQAKKQINTQAKNLKQKFPPTETIENVLESEQNILYCFDCKIQKADPKILGYYQICRPCYTKAMQQIKQFKKTQPKKPEIDLIENNLFLGNEDASLDKSLLQKLNIKSILICGQNLDIMFPKDFTYKKYAIADDSRQNIQIYFDEAFDWIENQHKLSRNVFLHCAQGISRSASFTIAYIMKKKNLGYEEAFQYVKSKRDIISPNQGFVEMLRNYQHKILGITI